MFFTRRSNSVGRDAAEQRGELHLVVDVDARGAAADGVDARQVRGGAPERVHDPVPVVVRGRAGGTGPTPSPRSRRRGRR